MARDIDEMYKPDTGERVLPCSEMNEKMYLIVRSIANRNAKQPYVLQKFDIIKLGRVKFKIKDISINKVKKARENKREAMKRREQTWKKNEILKAQ